MTTWADDRAAARLEGQVGQPCRQLSSPRTVARLVQETVHGESRSTFRTISMQGTNASPMQYSAPPMGEQAEFEAQASILDYPALKRKLLTKYQSFQRVEARVGWVWK